MARVHTEEISSLKQYQRKRNFAATPEPKGERTKSKAQLEFVIQKHAASHLHYDFRLELEGTLKSWAVPKGPSLDPHDKRLAMHVEDHPLSYANFEGVIPAGNYGAGTVIVWDNGHWEPIGDPVEGYRKGKLKFHLHGKKLSGIWNLVRSYKNDPKSKNAWFLIKHGDEAARPISEFNVIEALPDSVLGGEAGRVWRSNRSKNTQPLPKQKAHLPKKKAHEPRLKKMALPKAAKQAPLPLTLSPQLAMLVDQAPAGEGWIYEIKYDGYRVLARIDENGIRLFTRNGNDWTSKLGHLAKSIEKLGLSNGWLDGEIVVSDKDGRPNFQKLQNAFENQTTASIEYYLFDLLYLNDHDLRALPLIERRQLLSTLLEKAPPSLHLSEIFDVPARKLLENACEMKLEGLIGKRANAPYQSTRSRDWIKLKCLQRQEFVIGGYTDPTGSRTGTFGSLLLGVHDLKTRKLRYAGRVGTGFTDTTLRELIKKLKPLKRETMPFEEFTGERPTRKMHWVEPKLVGEVAFSEWTEGGHLRHPSFQGLRSDKAARAITQEKILPVAQVAPRKASKAKTPKSSSKSAEKNDTQVAGITISHGERVIDATSGYTKLDLVRYYEEIAPLMLPQLKDRPVSLVRAPQGIDANLFFQKHLDSIKIPSVRQLHTDLFPGHPPLIAIDSVEALIACAQMNVVEFHTWNATVDHIDKPDRMIFDLDPGEGIEWVQVQEAAKLMKVFLDEIGLKSLLKTSGGKGLHIVVLLKPQYDWDTVKSFSQAIVRHLAEAIPQLFVAKSGPKNRRQRIFIDYLRNGYGATTVAAFSVRARKGLGVSVPIAWDDLDSITSSGQWSIHGIDQILETKELAREFTRASKQTLTKPARHLDFDLP